MTGEKPQANGGGVRDSLIKLLLGSSAGADAMVVYLVYDLMRQRPDSFFTLVQGWGPSFVLVSAMLWMGNSMSIRHTQFAERQLEVAREAAAANARLAGAVESLASRDDQRAREQEITLNHLAKQSHDIMEKLDSIALRLPTP